MCLSQLAAGGIKGAPCDLWEGTLSSLSLVSLLLHPPPPVRFPFIDFALSPFTVMAQSCEHSYMWEPVNPPIESLDLVLGTLT